MTFETVFNPTQAPVPVSQAGTTVDGHGWATADTDDPYTARALTSGRLTIVDTLDPPGDDIDPRVALVMLSTLQARPDAAPAKRSSRNTIDNPDDAAPGATGETGS